VRELGIDYFERVIRPFSVSKIYVIVVLCDDTAIIYSILSI